jgi:hypothetical protein
MHHFSPVMAVVRAAPVPHLARTGSAVCVPPVAHIWSGAHPIVTPQSTFSYVAMWLLLHGWMCCGIAACFCGACRLQPCVSNVFGSNARPLWCGCRPAPVLHKPCDIFCSYLLVAPLTCFCLCVALLMCPEHKHWLPHLMTCLMTWRVTVCEVCDSMCDTWSTCNCHIFPLNP